MAYIGAKPVSGLFQKQTLTTDGSTTTFSLDLTVASTTAIIVSVGGVIQNPDTAYTLSGGGTSIVFTAAPASTDTTYIHYLGIAVIQTMTDVNGTEFILDADADTSLTADTDDEVDIKVGGTDRSTIKTTGFHNIDSYKFVAGTGDDMQIYHDGSNSYITNATGALKLATETSGIAITIGHSTSEVTVADNMTVAGDLTVTGTASFGDTNITNVGSITLDSIANDGTDGVTIDSSTDVIIDAGGADIILKDDGTEFGRFTNDSTDFVIKVATQDKDIKFIGDDGGSAVTALTLDMSNAGDATFNRNIAVGGNAVITGDLTVNGTTTTLATTNSTITDSLIELGNGTSGTPANDAGLVIERGSSDNAFIGFDESADKFIVGTGSFTGASTGNLTITTGTLVANLEGAVTGNASTATALATARNIAGQSFDGSANITIASTDLSDTASITLLTSSQTLTNKTLTSPVLNTGVSGTAVKDEDNMASDSATHLATQQSIKAYVDGKVSDVTASSSTTFTNKSIDSDNNTITNIVNADIKASAAIAMSKLEDLTASRALASDANGDVSVTSVTSTELGYLDGVSSAIQTQLDAKQATVSSSARLNANLIHDGTISNTEFGYLNNLTGNIQTQIDAKQATLSTSNRLDADLLHDGSISNTEFGYLNNVSSNIQTQLDNKTTKGFAIAMAIAL